MTGDSSRVAWLQQARSYLPSAAPVLARLIDEPGRAEQAADNGLMAELTAIPGIDPWTVQGALLIALQREDVVLPGDLALRKATARIALAAPPGAASAAPATPRPPVITRTYSGQFWLW